MKILISGVGIGGAVLAYWLKKFGFDPTIVEKAPGLRPGGQIIEMYWDGFSVLKKMGLASTLTNKSFGPAPFSLVDKNGEKICGYSANDVNQVSDGEYLRVVREDLANAIYQTIEGSVEVIFGDTIKGIHPTSDFVRVEFEKGEDRQFDLVIGADGIHSNVRELVFGAESQFEQRLGYFAAVFEEKDYKDRPDSPDLAFTNRGKYLQTYSLGNRRTSFLMCVLEENVADGILHDREHQKDLLKRNFSNEGWECSQIVKLLDKNSDFYFDRISQIKMKNWSKGRVGLIGDAAHCASLWSGEGALLAIVSAYVLAGELRRFKGDYEKAFSSHHMLLKPFVEQRQKMGVFWGKVLIPKTIIGRYLLDLIFRLMQYPLATSLLWLRPKFSIPDYESLFD